MESFKAFQGAQTLKLTCDERALPSRIWRPDRVDYLAPLTALVFFFFVVYGCVCTLQNEQELVHLPDVLTRLISCTTHHCGR